MKRLLRLAAQLLPALLALGLLAFVLRGADLSRALDLVHSLGWKLPLLLLPNLFCMLSETAAWWVLFGRVAARPRALGLFAVRLAGEALLMGLPSGSMVNESMQPYLLKRRCGVPLETGIVATIGRKFFGVLAHGVFLALATLLTWPELDRASHATIGRGGLPWLLLAGASTLTALALAGALATAHGRMADRLHRRLDRWGGRWLGSWLERNAVRFAHADADLASFFTRDQPGLVPPLLLYLLAWLFRALETLVFLRLLGVHVSLPESMVIESSLILLRALAVPVPGGLGVQDVGYVLSFRALSLPDATTVGAAFVLMKRGKDLFWVALGFLVLALGGRASRGEAVRA
ncbi:MAG: lysylphosphatidylglycerol synthase domain-containing protein [Betaproteobacteria bacterium]